MRLLALLILNLLILLQAAEQTFENSILSFRYPDVAALNESDFDFVPEVSWRLAIDGKPLLIGLQADDESSQQMLLDRAKSNIMRHLDGGTTSDLSTFGAIQRCKGFSAKGTSRHPQFQGAVTVYALSFTSGKKIVLLIAINPDSDKRFEQAIGVIRNSVKLKNN
jgi:hypothetical protein